MEKTITKKQIKNYFDAWRNVYKDTRLSRGDLAIMITIQDQAYSDIWFSYQTFADRTGMQRVGVIRSIKRLTSFGYLHKVPGKKKTSTNHYILREDLRSPFKDYDEVERLLTRFQDSQDGISQASSAEIGVSAKIPISIPEDTSTNALADTLMYKDTNEQNNERETDDLSGLRPKIMSRGGETVIDDFDKVETLATNETISSGFGELDDMALWNVAKKFSIMPEAVETKYKDVQLALERKQTYGTKSTLQLLELFISKDLAKGFIEKLDASSTNIIDFYHPVEEIKSNELSKALSFELYKEIQTASIEKYFERGNMPYACDAVIDYYLFSKGMDYYGSNKSKEAFIDWKVKHRNKAAIKIAELFKGGISIQQFKDCIKENPKASLKQLILELTEQVELTN